MKQWLDDARATFRDALRALSRYPAAAASSVALVAFGAAFVTLAVVLTWRVIFHPRDAAPHAAEMLVAAASDPERGIVLADFFGRRFAYIARRQTTLECWVASRPGSTTVKDDAAGRHGVRSHRSSRGFRECWGLTLVLGREFREADHAKGAEKTALLGERVWREVFGADPGVVGRTLEIGRDVVRVVGLAVELSPRSRLGPKLTSCHDDRADRS